MRGGRALDGGGYRSAVGVSQDDHQGNAQVLHGVLHAAQDGLVGHVSGGADDEEVAHTLVKEDLRRDAGIGAPQDDGEGLLPGEGLPPARGVLAGMLRPAGSVSPVALF